MSAPGNNSFGEEESDSKAFETMKKDDAAFMDREESEVDSLPQNQVSEGDYPTGFRLIFIVIALGISMFLVALDLTIVATAIPKITDEFHGLGQVSWYGSAFFMTLGGFQSAWGKIYKYFPLKTSFLFAIFTFELGSLICGVSPNSNALIVGRAIAGLGAAGLSTGCYTILGFAAEPKKRPMFTGIVGASYGIASVAGPLVGGILSDRVTWRWCFYINLPIGGASALIVFLFFQNPAMDKKDFVPLIEKLRQLDPVGVVLVMAGLISYILTLEYGGQTHAWSSATVIGLIVGSVVIFATFAVWELSQGDRAMIPVRLIKQRTYGVTSLYWFFFAGGYFLFLYYLPIYFQSIDNVTPIESGVRNLPFIIAVMFATILAGASITETGHATPVLIVCTAIATIAAGLFYTLNIGTGTGKWVGYQIFAGIGYGGAFQIPIIIGQATAEKKDLAEVTAILLFFQTIGSALFISAAQSTFVNVLISKLSTTAPEVLPNLVVATGVTQLRSTFSADEIPGILKAYMTALKAVFAVGIAATGVAFCISLAFSWKKLNREAIKNGGAA